MTESKHNQKLTNTVNELPVPDKDAALHSEKVRQCLFDKIADKGSISFTEFMQTVLYEPGLGYYSAGSTKLGAEGDFITAPEISPLFSQSIAQAILPALDAIDESSILEVGAGSGKMATNILQHLNHLDNLPEKYYILELSADLRLRQQQYIKSKAAELYERVEWLDSIPENLNAVVIANELLDAMPVVRFKKEKQGISTEHVIIEDGEFKFNYILNSDNNDSSYQRICQRLQKIESENAELNPGFKSEINFNAEDWLTSISEKLNSGVILLIDYGYPQHEYYHEQRNNGTLTCFYRHRHHDNPFIYPGLQDLTAHVDFTAIADCAIECGMNVLGYTTQSNFLFGAGIAQLAEEKAVEFIEQDNIVEQIELTNKIKKLTMPYEMGEIIKVIAFSKNCTVSLDAFHFNDMRDHL